MNPDRHAEQFPQYRAMLDAATSNDNDENDCMAVGIRRKREGIGRRRLRVGVAVLGDNEIVGNEYLHSLPAILSDCFLSVTCHSIKTVQSNIQCESKK